MQRDDNANKCIVTKTQCVRGALILNRLVSFLSVTNICSICAIIALYFTVKAYFLMSKQAAFT